MLGSNPIVLRLRALVGSIPLLGDGLRSANRSRHALRSSSLPVVTSANSRLAYSRLWRDETLLEQYLAGDRLAFYDEVAAICAEFSPASVIDAGCGSGHLLARIAERTGAHSLAGFDNVRNAIRLARRTVPGARLFTADIYSVDAGETFELVVCTEVLEHLDDPERALRALLRLAAPGGHVIVSVPDGDVDDFGGHVNFWNESAFAEFLSRYGLREVRVIPDEVCPTLVGILDVPTR